MSDAVCTDALKRLACVRGHVEAIAQMVERGDDDLAIAHQLRAVRGALIQIQVRLLRAQLDRWADQPIEPAVIENALIEIMKTRRQHESNRCHMSRLRHEVVAPGG
jgi:DNA-binding FrmR family transcriptional regulator